MTSSLTKNAILALLCVVLIVVGIGSVQALTPAGSVIRNQASASFRDASGLTRTVTSNSVETLIQQVAGLTITQDQSRLVAAGTQVSFPHVITNTGNGVDRYQLAVANAGGDDFNVNNLQFFADADQNGVADNTVPVLTTPNLAVDASYYVVVTGDVPSTVTQGQNAVLSVNATSTFDGSITGLNADTAVVTAGALVEVTKSMVQLSGASPSGTYAVTLNYQNTSGTAANTIVLIDALPQGMSYVPDSGRWSLTGAVVLTDSGPTDVQGSAGNTITYCAFEPSCIGLPEADIDPDADSTNQVTAILAQLGAGESGTLEFEVTIDSGLSAGSLINTAEYEYASGTQLGNRQLTNPVSFTIEQHFAVIANGSATDATDGVNEPVTLTGVGQGQSAYFDNTIWNAGNGDDTFDITIDTVGSSFPTGSVFELLHGDGQTLLVDTDGNGLVDTGVVSADDFFPVVLRVTLPAAVSGNNGGAGYDVTLSAQSIGDNTQSNEVINHLDQILLASVDITNSAAIGQPGVTGFGLGPESQAVTTQTLDPGSSTEFLLFVNNTSLATDDYSLSVSLTADFSSSDLPPGWIVDFRRASDDAPLLDTGSIASGESLGVIATITVATTQVPVTQSVYFRALSATTGATDIKHDAVTVRRIDAVQLEPQQSGQTEPGGFRVYTHLLSSHGNADIANISLTVTDDLAANGWVTTIYLDGDDNGSLDATDPVATQIPLLVSASSVRLFLRVYAPATENQGTSNVTTLTASWDTDSVTISDVTTINQGAMTILKEQAMDTGCDDVLDSTYTVTTFALPPGNNCVHYRLTATNTGVVPLYNALIQDATPAFTTYQPIAQCSVSACTVIEPVAGDTGVITAQVAEILPGESVELTFAVVLE